MATSSLTILTKYTSGTTIVTADVANAWFGGLYGSFEAESLSADDPRVIGHQHDGQPYDGHSSKINLVNHVEGQLQNQNLGTDSVTKRTVASFLNQNLAIPEYEIILGNKYYNLNLSVLYNYIDDLFSVQPFKMADTATPTSLDAVVQTDTDYGVTGLDFVFGSSKLDDMSDGTNGDNRLLFDKSKGAFRAGGVDADQWDDANRGGYSAAFGYKNKVAAFGAFSAGEGNRIDAGNYEATVFGKNNTADAKICFVSGEEALATISGEVVHASGKIAIKGDAQSSEYTVRGVNIGSGGIVLSADGSGENFKMNAGENFAITVVVTAKMAAPSIEGAVYKLEAMGIGTSGVITTAVVTNIFRSAYFSAGAPNVAVSLTSASNEIRISIVDSTLVTIPTAWAATVSLTKLSY